jgi:hypothetical protein
VPEGDILNVGFELDSLPACPASVRNIRTNVYNRATNVLVGYDSMSPQAAWSTKGK